MKTKIYEGLAEHYELWRDATLGSKSHYEREALFVRDVFRQSGKPILSVIDLGGGVGLHADVLERHGYEVTVFDQSRKALGLARKRNAKIKVIQGSFENIAVPHTYDAAICMWSSLSYIHTVRGRRRFYRWLKRHVRHVIILDQPRFEDYPATFEAAYKSRSGRYELRVHREWKMAKSSKTTRFTYHLLDAKTGVERMIRDGEKQSYRTTKQLQKLLGPDYALLRVYSDYAVRGRSRKNRMITVFSPVHDTRPGEIKVVSRASRRPRGRSWRRRRSR